MTIASQPVGYNFCGVCLNSFDEMHPDVVVDHHQGHKFCKVCITSYPILGSMTCPFPRCRKSIDDKIVKNWTYSWSTPLVKMIGNLGCSIASECDTFSMYLGTGRQIIDLQEFVRDNFKFNEDASRIIQKLNRRSSNVSVLVDALHDIQKNNGDSLLMEPLPEEFEEMFSKMRTLALQKFEQNSC